MFGLDERLEALASTFGGTELLAESTAEAKN
jgi:hypothetical protein